MIPTLPTLPTSIPERLALVEQRIADACAASGRDPAGVKLLPVSKTKPVEDIRQVLAAGYSMVAENRVQEIVEKAPSFTPDEVSWALIGHLQSNKVRQVVQHVTQFQALDSARLATALDRRLEEAERTLDVMVQVNTSGEQTKAGLAPDQVVAFCADLDDYPRLRPVGLMTIASNTTDEAEVGRCFARLAGLRDRLREEHVAGSDWPELSMGMSNDLEQAVAHGATVVRVGRAIFGDRPPTD